MAKMTKTQLKAIIAEELKRVQLNEAGGWIKIAREVEALADAADADWKSRYERKNPAHGDRNSWNQRCDDAAEHLDEMVRALVLHVEEQLWNGDEEFQWVVNTPDSEY